MAGTLACRRFATSAAFAAMVGGAFAQAPDACPPLDAAARVKLIGYVQKKYKVPATIPVEVRDTGIIPESCYRKLEFRSGDASRPLHLDLTASPDFRFLTRDLMDSRVDPAIEERRQKQELLAKLARGGAPVLGAKEAPVTVTVFSDFQCPYCSQAAKGLIEDILPGTGGAVRLEYRAFPLAMHAWAQPAAEVGACAQQHGDRYFWSFHDYFFAHQKELKPETVAARSIEYGAGLSGLDTAALKTCVEQRASAAAVQRDLALGKELGVTGTPTIFVNGERIGGYRVDQLRTMIERAMPRKEEAGQQ